jgi:hypothetical protein
MNWVEARAKGEDDGRGEEDEWVSAQAAVWCLFGLRAANTFLSRNLGQHGLAMPTLGPI